MIKKPLTYQSLRQAFEPYKFPREELDELAYLIFLLPNDEARKVAIKKLLISASLMNQVTGFIKKKLQFLGEINEPGWDRVMSEQKKLLADLSQ
jgi:hypothetical protein